LLTLVRLSGWDDPDHGITFPVAVTHDKDTKVKTHSQQDEPLFLLRMVWIEIDHRILVKEHRLRLLEGNPVFGGRVGRPGSARSGGDLDRRVEVDLPGRPRGNYRTPPWTWKPSTVSLHTAKMQLDSPLDAAQGRVNGLAGSHTARQVGN